MDKSTPYKYLPHIDSPADLRRLRPDELPEVCAELRRDIIEELAVNPGHLGSSLGAVELTVAIHYVFDTPDDLLVWDVGHQAYGHKILTGRRDRFSTNRRLGGLKPFPSPEESPYDTFACGHASNSISAALGMAVARRLGGGPAARRHTVAVIGDGSMSGGLAFEGLNNVSESPADLLIVLNDNDMSIDRAVGGMKQYLKHLHTSRGYNSLRFGLSRLLMRAGLLTPRRRAGLIRLGNALKSALWRSPNVFEGMNIRYFGPADGHDVVELVRILGELKQMSGPRMLHLHTQKGHGYAPAEASATVWHAPGRFDVESGELLEPSAEGRPPRYQDVFGETLVELARADRRIVGVTPAMPTGSGIGLLMQALPGRAFDVGIAEGHAVTFSAGMAKEGLLPFCAIYSSFAQRAYDNIIHDAALLGLPVTLCLDRAGLVGQDGPTHHGVFDLCALRPVPGITIASPYDERELRRLMYTAARRERGVFVIRYPRGCGRLTDWRCPLETVEPGTGRRLSEGTSPVCLLTLGPIGQTGADALGLYARRHPRAASVAHYDLRFLKPLDENLLEDIALRHTTVVTLEDGARQGGMGSAVLEWLADHGHATRVVRLGLPDRFVEHGTPDELYRLTGLDAESICRVIEAETSNPTAPRT